MGLVVRLVLWAAGIICLWGVLCYWDYQEHHRVVVSDQYPGVVITQDTCFIPNTMVRTNDLERWCRDHGAHDTYLLN